MLKTKNQTSPKASTKKQESPIILVPDRYNYRDKDYSASKILAELETAQEQDKQEQQQQDEDVTGCVIELMLSVDSLSKVVDSLVSRIEILETRRKLIR